jgi:hypothetical protein
MKLIARRVLLGAIVAALMFPAASCIIRERDHYYQHYDRDDDGRDYRYRR